MQSAGYYIALPFIYLFSLLPYRVLYVLSDISYILVYHVFGYRKKVVIQNLNNAFPAKTEAEREQIRKQFYHYLCDLFFETFKHLTASRKTELRHCSLDNESLSLFEHYRLKGKSVIIVMGHFGDWEGAGLACSAQCRQPLYAIYHPLKNKKFDSLIFRMRSRFGGRLLKMSDTFREMLSKKDEPSITAFIADQTPSSPDSAFWTTFLNQDAPVFRGTETISKKLNYPVLYGSVMRVKRGQYRVHVETLFETPSLTEEGEITIAHTRRLEKDILAMPETWLWSHRRWKHRKPKV